MNSLALADELELWGIEQDCLLFQDGSLGFALKIKPTDISCISDETINSITQGVAQFLNGLPPEIDLQFVQDIKGGNASVLDVHESLIQESSTEAAQALTRARIEKLRTLDGEGFIPKHELLLLVRKPLTRSLVDAPKLLSKPANFPKIADARMVREVELLEQLRENVSQSIASLGLEVRRIETNRVLELIYEQWNPDRPVSLGTYDPEDIRSSLLFSDVGVYERGFSIGEVHHRLISLKTLPDRTVAGMASALRDLPFNSRLFLTVHVPNQTKELEKLQTQRRLAFSMARGKRSGVSDIESEAKLQDLETLLEQMIAQGENVFRVSLNILLRSNNLGELEEKVAQTLMCIRSLSGAEGMEESIAAFDIFSECAIPNTRSKERAKAVKTSNLADLLPLYGPWEGMSKPSILLRSRMGSLLGFDPFDPGLTNFNQLISGSSGSGKSFLTNLLLLQTLKEAPKIYFVDIGGSYKKLCENLDGQYVLLGIGAGLCLNPFDLGPGESAPSSQKIKFFVSLIELMTKEDHEARIPKLHRAEIEEAIQRVYEKSRTPRLSDLQDLLLAHPDVEVKRYGRILSPWCGNTPFGQFLDRETNIELNRPIVAFDLKGMESFPDLQAVCLFMITDFVWREIQRDRGKMKFLVFDECWKLLKNDSGLVFIEEVFRTFRKYYASAIAISQDLDDFAKSKIAGAILPNCSIKWLLLQQQVDGKRLEEVLNLNPNEISLVKSLRQDKGRYSEAFLLAQANRTVAVIESTPLEYWIATTDPKDLAALDEHTSSHPSLSHVDRLKKLAELFPRGVAASEKESS
ncbi:MAG: ATP-binding protein [Bacteriovoracia bacterium]